MFCFFFLHFRLDCRWIGKCIHLLPNIVKFVLGSKLSKFKSLVNIANVDAQRCSNHRKSRYALNRDCSNTNQPITNCKCTFSFYVSIFLCLILFLSMLILLSCRHETSKIKYSINDFLWLLLLCKLVFRMPTCLW